MEYWPGCRKGDSGASTSGISLCSISCISICSPMGRKFGKKGIKRKRRNKGKSLYTEHYQVREKSFNF